MASQLSGEKAELLQRATQMERRVGEVSLLNHVIDTHTDSWFVCLRVCVCVCVSMQVEEESRRKLAEAASQAEKKAPEVGITSLQWH